MIAHPKTNVDPEEQELEEWVSFLFGIFSGPRLNFNPVQCQVEHHSFLDRGGPSIKDVGFGRL